jgi:hypothetical protein
MGINIYNENGKLLLGNIKLKPQSMHLLGQGGENGLFLFSQKGQYLANLKLCINSMLLSCQGFNRANYAQQLKIELEQGDYINAACILLALHNMG